MNEDGSIYGECMSNYMDLEFYDKELTDSKRTLIALSNFLKDKIDPALFARAYHQIITAGYAENSIPLDYLKSDMILAGLSKPEHIKNGSMMSEKHRKDTVTATVSTKQ